jgi:hypothetical protein
MNAQITFPEQEIAMKIRTRELRSEDYPKFLLVRGSPQHWLVCDTGSFNYGWHIECETPEEAAEIVANMNAGSVTEAQAELLIGASKWKTQP